MSPWSEARCLDEASVVALLRGELSEEAVGRVDAHIDGCAACRVLVSHLAEVDVTAHASLIAGRFEIGRLLGAGGMGDVYRAHDRVTDASVAIKVLHALGPVE